MRESETLQVAAETTEAPMEALKKAPEMAPLSQLALSPILWLSSLVDGHWTLSDSASPEDSMVRFQPEVGRQLVAEARMWSLEHGSLLRLFCGRTEMRT